jgi:tetratricopeptide (TPR) repeat protein
MRAVLFLLFFTVFIKGVLKSQTDAKKDSLLLQIKTSKNDTAKVNAMLSTSNYLMDKEPNEAYIIITEAMRLATKIKWNRGKEESYITKGQYYYSQSEFTKTLECWQEALKYKETLKVVQKNGDKVAKEPTKK